MGQRFFWNKPEKKFFFRNKDGFCTNGLAICATDLVFVNMLRTTVELLKPQKNRLRRSNSACKSLSEVTTSRKPNLIVQPLELPH